MCTLREPPCSPIRAAFAWHLPSAQRARTDTPTTLQHLAGGSSAPRRGTPSEPGPTGNQLEEQRSLVDRALERLADEPLVRHTTLLCRTLDRAQQFTR